MSAKLAAGKLRVINNIDINDHKTSLLTATLSTLGLSSVLVIDGQDVNKNFLLAASNIIGVDVLPQQGANVYDILRHDEIVLTEAAVKCLEERLA